jgi:hypothetical protein
VNVESRTSSSAIQPLSWNLRSIICVSPCSAQSCAVSAGCHKHHLLLQSTDPTSVHMAIAIESHNSLVLKGGRDQNEHKKSADTRTLDLRPASRSTMSDSGAGSASDVLYVCSFMNELESKSLAGTVCLILIRKPNVHCHVLYSFWYTIGEKPIYYYYYYYKKARKIALCRAAVKLKP